MDQSAFDLTSPANLSTFLKRLFTEDFMPHGHCYFWRPDVLWLHVISDIGIALAYFSIPIMLIIFVLKRKDIPFHWMFLLFGLFIFFCGSTHVIDVITTWVPIYRFEGFVKLITAIISLTTAALLIPILPKVLTLPSLQGAIEELTNKSKELEKINKDLERFNRASIGREERILELKQEINKLSGELGRQPPYELVE